MMASLLALVLIGAAPPGPASTSSLSASASEPSPERVEELKSTIAHRRAFRNAEHQTANLARAEIQRELQIMAMQEAIAEAAALRSMQKSNSKRHNPNHHSGGSHYHMPTMHVQRMPVIRVPERREK